jgi:beta-lactamase superfamily II metal-dependent hydrolase
MINNNFSFLKVIFYFCIDFLVGAFLTEIMPAVVEISIGKNSHGYTADEVLERLEKYDIKTLRMDEDRDIKIISNGKNYGFPDFQNKN